MAAHGGKTVLNRAVVHDGMNNVRRWNQRTQKDILEDEMRENLRARADQRLNVRAGAHSRPRCRMQY